MRDVPTTWEELLKWCDGHAAYSDRFIDFQRWIAEAEARATATERDRCSKAALVTPKDLNSVDKYDGWHALAVRLNALIRARIVPPPPVDELVLTIANQLMKGVSGGSNFTSFAPVVASMFAAQIAAAIRAIEAKNV
jgi:hypothetical protein